MKIKPAIVVSMMLAPFLLSSCVYHLSVHSKEGEKLSGRYRFARDETGVMQITVMSGEVLSGKFIRVGRTNFVTGYETTFGRGSIDFEGADTSHYGNVYGGLFGAPPSLTDAAAGETFDRASGEAKTIVRGPLFYWMASLQGDRGATMGCYFIGSAYTGHGFGRCKAHDGNEYTVEF